MGVNVLKLKPSLKSRRGRELDARAFDDREWEAFMESDATQWRRHLDLGAVQIIPPEEAMKIDKKDILPVRSRFVRTNKGEGDELIASSRLVVPGHLQPGRAAADGGDRTDSPTAPQLAFHLAVAIAASKKWTISSFDVSAAFLRGDLMQENVYFMPPKEGLDGVPDGALVKALKGVFGLRKSPRLWWKKACATIEKCGFKLLDTLPGTFVLRKPDGSATGIIILHVDDGFMAGHGELYEKKRSELLRYFEVKHEKVKMKEFMFLGLMVKQLDDGEIQLDQESYLADMKEIFVPRVRRQAKDDAAKLTEKELGDLKSLIGQLAWASRRSVPQIAFDVSDIQQRYPMATVLDLLRANATLRETKRVLKQEKLVLRFPPLKMNDLAIVCVSDASFAQQPLCGSQMGYMVLLSTTDMEMGRALATPLEWGSKKISRVVKSTLAAEAAAMSFAFDRALFARAGLEELLVGRLGPREDIGYTLPMKMILTEKSGRLKGENLKMMLATDCRSLFDMCLKPTGSSTEKRVQLDLMDVRSEIDKNSQVTIKWVPTDSMLVDGLTKHLSKNVVLDLFMKKAQYGLRADPVLEEARHHERLARRSKFEARALSLFS